MIYLDKEHQEEKKEEKDQEEFIEPELTLREQKEIIEQMFHEIGFEVDPKLVEQINKEGDFEEWTDPYSNYLCRIVRIINFQNWNGYVRISKDHPCYGKDCDDIDVNVHGGLTFASDEFLTRGKDIPKHKGYWWVGFDTAHAGDKMPRRFFNYPSYFKDDYEVYRDKEYVTNQVTSLAKQLKDMEGC